MDISYKKLTTSELDVFIDMRITQLTEEYVSSGRTVPTDVDLQSALKDYYNRHLADGTFASWLAMDGNKIDNFTYIPKEEDDLTPVLRENLSLEDLEKTWMSRLGED